jgi:hypothetical protein
MQRVPRRVYLVPGKRIPGRTPLSENSGVIDARGGMNRGNDYEKVEATIVSGGGLFPSRGG